MILSLTIETLSIIFEKTIGKTELHNEITVKSLPRFNQLLLSTSRNSELMVNYRFIFYYLFIFFIV